MKEIKEAIIVLAKLIDDLEWIHMADGVRRDVRTRVDLIKEILNVQSTGKNNKVHKE